MQGNGDGEQWVVLLYKLKNTYKLLKQLAYRYYHQGIELEYINIPITTKQERLNIGCLDKIHLSNFHLYLKGRTSAESLKIRTAGETKIVRPYYNDGYPDEHSEFGKDHKGQFQIMVNYSDKLDITAELEGEWLQCKKVRLMSFSRRMKTALKAMMIFTRLLICCPFSLYRYYIQRDEMSAGVIKAFLQGAKRKKDIMSIDTAALKKTGGKLNIYFGHTYGGGSELYLKERIQEDAKEGAVSVVVREDPFENGYRFEVPVNEKGGSLITTEPSLARDFLAQAERKHFIYSTLAGAKNALWLIESFLEFYNENKDDFTVLFHDYYTLCPSFTLLNNKGRYCHLPDLNICCRCYQSLPAARAVKVSSIAEWRERWGSIFELCNTIVVFSASSRELVTKVYPKIEKKIVLKPHHLNYVPKKVAFLNRDSGFTIGVLGTLVYHKGAEVLFRMADFLDGNNKKIVVFGDLDPRFAHRNIEVHGPYRREEISLLAGHYNLSCWFIPSIWPETFSYTTHEALATGLPVFSFNLGAQAEVINNKPNGHVLELSSNEESLILSGIEETLKNYYFSDKV